MSEKKYWRLEYLPATIRGTVREYVFEGTEEERNAHFLKHHVCDACKDEMRGGWQPLYSYNPETEKLEDRGEGHHVEPYTNPFHSGCGCEWDVEEITWPPKSAQTT